MGYHFDPRALIDPTAQVAAVGQALACGLDGYVVDVEDEVKDPATHTNLGIGGKLEALGQEERHVASPAECRPGTGRYRLL